TCCLAELTSTATALPRTRAPIQQHIENPDAQSPWRKSLAARSVAACDHPRLRPQAMTDGKRHPGAMQPRIVRFRDAPFYLGMDRGRFNAEVRPYLTEIPIGKQGIGFDRLELDAWVDDYLCRNGRPGKGVTTWDARKYPASSCEPGAGIS